MKFKAGDKVRVKGLSEIIKTREGTYDFRGTGWDDDMDNYCGNVLTIAYIDTLAEEYHMVEDNGDWCWTDDMLEDEPITNIPMWPTAEDTQKVKEAADKLLEQAAEEAAKLPLYSDTQQSDPVNHPDHYISGGMQCWDAIKASMTHEAFCGYLKGNVQKYIWRYEKKVAPVEDLHKAAVYLNKLIEELNDNTPNS